jgi:branched-subunit amino acid transport protein
MIWTTLVLAGLVTFFTRFSMIALLKKDYFSPRVKIVLSYIPSAVFPAIIFPAIFLNSTGQLVFLDNPKVLAALIAVLVGYLTESVIATILSGLGVLWFKLYFKLSITFICADWSWSCDASFIFRK